MTPDDWRWILGIGVALEVLAFIWLGFKMGREG